MLKLTRQGKCRSSESRGCRTETGSPAHRSHLYSSLQTRTSRLTGGYSCSSTAKHEAYIAAQKETSLVCSALMLVSMFSTELAVLSPASLHA